MFFLSEPDYLSWLVVGSWDPAVPGAGFGQLSGGEPPKHPATLKVSLNRGPSNVIFMCREEWGLIPQGSLERGHAKSRPDVGNVGILYPS